MKQQFIFHSNSAQKTGEIAVDLIRAFPECSIFALQGEIGSGKTTLVKGALQQLLQTDDVSFVTSPTFTYMHIYEHGHLPAVYHFDLYRLSTLQEFNKLGLNEYISEGHKCFIEWPDLIAPLLPATTLWINITHEMNGERIIAASQSSRIVENAISG